MSQNRMLCAAFAQCFMDCCHLFIFMQVTDTQGGAALRHTSPADGNQRHTVQVHNLSAALDV